jgi:hypothetical protein
MFADKARISMKNTSTGAALGAKKPENPRQI